MTATRRRRAIVPALLLTVAAAPALVAAGPATAAGCRYVDCIDTTTTVLAKSKAASSGATVVRVRFRVDASGATPTGRTRLIATRSDGTVTRSGRRTYTGGAVTQATPKLAPGRYTIKVVYSPGPDSQFVASSARTSIRITK